MTDEEDIKRARKEKLKVEAEKLGISYKELKAQKKASKEKKHSREADKLETSEHKQDMKRMRSWSKDEKDPTANGGDEKRRRTRSMDAKDEKENTTPSGLTPAEWRKEENITIKGHGKYQGFDVDALPQPFLKFTDAPFNQVVQKSFVDAGFDKPTAIQSQAWPIAIRGDDMICVAKTGSGKTCGFLLPSIHQHINSQGRTPNRGHRKPVLLVLAPTRELACQIMDETRKFGRAMGFSSVCCYGGSSKYPQIAQLERGVDCIIATPGRINDLLEMRKADLSNVKFLVLDEADRMLDMGFEPQIRSVVKHVPDSRQTLLFSATWPREIQQLAHDFLRDPIQVNVGDVNSLNANKDIKQHIVMCNDSEKFEKLATILKDLTDQGVPETEGKPTNGRAPRDLGGKKHPKIIVFTAKKISCNDLANQLWDDGFAVDCLHGDRAQWERTKVINAFKEGTLRMLIATDVAARGLDVKDVGVVVNYDMPTGTNGVEDYVHRIGRTGRAGAKGVAHTFFTQTDRKCATQLVEVLKKAEQEIPAELQAMVRTRFGGRGRGGGRGYGGRGRGGGGGRGRGYMGGGGSRGYGGGFGRGGGGYRR
jgi:ATP-dependent RNA helicase DDX5/DBP2